MKKTLEIEPAICFTSIFLRKQINNKTLRDSFSLPEPQFLLVRMAKYPCHILCVNKYKWTLKNYSIREIKSFSLLFF